MGRIIVFLCSFAFILASISPVFALPVTVNTSTSGEATANVSQRRVVIDTVNNNRHWAFYRDGAVVRYSVSANGTAWSTVGELPYNTSEFAVSYSAIGGVPYVFFVSEANDHDIVLRRGILSESTITFESELTVFDGSSESDRYVSPSVAVDGNDQLWVAGVSDIGPDFVDRLQAVVRRSVGAASTSPLTFQDGAAVGRRSSEIRDLVLLPQAGEEMYLLMNTDAPNLVGFRFDGEGWTRANGGGEKGWFTFPVSMSIETRTGVTSQELYNGELIIAGNFENFAEVPKADHIARWDGASWRALGDGLTGEVLATAVLGDYLYVGGRFLDVGGDENADYIARWDGEKWEALPGPQIECSPIRCFVVMLTTFGDDLYVGGDFLSAGGVADTAFLARWDGEAWHSVARGVNGIVEAVAVNGDGIYIGGQFEEPGGDPNASFLARWDGESLNAVGGGVDECVNLLVLDGDDLYVGGFFFEAGGNPNAKSIARWDGESWHSLGDTPPFEFATILAIHVEDDGVYVGGAFEDAGGNPEADNFARWDGGSWHAVGGGTNNAVSALLRTQDGFYVGGSFTDAGGAPDGDLIAEWLIAEERWEGLFRSRKSTIGTVSYLATIGDDVYVGGFLGDLTGSPDFDYIARWDGSEWHPLEWG